MDISDKKVAVLVSNYFEQAEFEEPIKALKDAGAEVTVIGTTQKSLTGLNHVDKGDKFHADLLIKNANSEDYDALVLPGGAINADTLRMEETAQMWVDDFLNTDRPLAAICHAPWLLVSSDNVQDRRMTSYYTIQDDIINAGGYWVDQSVVVDDNLITSRQPDDLPDFNNALIAMLSRRSPIVPDEESTEDDLAYTNPGNNRTELSMANSAKLKSIGLDKQPDRLGKKGMHDTADGEDYTEPESLRLSGFTPYDDTEKA